jgi:hypothetical protein
VERAFHIGARLESRVATRNCADHSWVEGGRRAGRSWGPCPLHGLDHGRRRVEARTERRVRPATARSKPAAVSGVALEQRQQPGDVVAIAAGRRGREWMPCP